MRGIIFTSILIFVFSVLASSQTNIFVPLGHLVKQEMDNLAGAFIEKKAVKATDKIPFDLEGGLIFVEAILGDKKRSYILDSGAPTLILNSKASPEDNIEAIASGVSGHVTVNIKKVENFQLGDINSKNIEAFVTDISHLEKIKKRSIEGLIGMEHFKDSEILIDYEKSEILVMPEYRGNIVEHFENVETISFAADNHMPVVKIKIGYKTYLFGIDTGAEVNLISKHLKKEIENQGRHLNEKFEIAGIDKNQKRHDSAMIEEVELNNRTFKNMKFVFADMKYLNESYAADLDGLLGYPFLKKAIFSIDYKNKKLCIWEKNLPEEFDLMNEKNVPSIAKVNNK